jgi:type VI secretion system protein ImpA
LCETFWDALHPQADEDVPVDEPGERFGQRIGNLTWLLTQVVEIAHTQPLIVGKADGATFGRRIIEAVRSRKPSDADADLEPNEAQIAQALAQTPADGLLASLDGAQAALDALARLQAVVDAQLGLEGPNFSTARTALQDTQHMLKRIAKERGLLQTSDANTSESVTAPETTATSAPAFNSGAPATRAQALAQLRQVAEYFRRTEPHSPVAYLADKAAKWGEVPLHQWLRSVLKDPASLAQIEELLGVEPPQA